MRVSVLMGNKKLKQLRHDCLLREEIAGLFSSCILCAIRHWLEAIPDWLNMTMIMQDTEVHFPEEKMPAASLDYFNCTGFNLI